MPERNLFGKAADDARPLQTVIGLVFVAALASILFLITGSAFGAENAPTFEPVNPEL